MLKDKKLYKLLKVSVPILSIMSFAFVLGGYAGWIATINKKDNLLKEYNTNPKIVENIVSQEQNLLTDYQNKKLSAEEFRDKIKEIKSEDNLFQTAESIYGQEVKEKRESLNTQRNITSGLIFSGIGTFLGTLALDNAKNRIKEELDEDILIG